MKEKIFDLIGFISILSYQIIVDELDFSDRDGEHLTRVPPTLRHSWLHLAGPWGRWGILISLMTVLAWEECAGRVGKPPMREVLLASNSNHRAGELAAWNVWSAEDL